MTASRRVTDERSRCSMQSLKVNAAPSNLRRSWRTHPQAPRVEGWMTSHASFREELSEQASVVSDACRFAVWASEGDDGTLRESTCSMLAAFSKSFQEQWIPRLHGHADFEDMSLFPYFRDNEGPSRAQFAQAAPQLMDEHQLMDAHERDIVDLATSLPATMTSSGDIGKIKADAKTLLNSFDEYHTLILEHLAQEEQLLLGAWLGLSQSEYEGNFTRAMQRAGHGSVVPLAATKSNSGKPAAPASPLPVLYDRRGRAVNMQTPGCCFEGVDSCCKGSAYNRLLQKWQCERD